MQLTFVARRDKRNKDGSLPIRAIITFNGERIRKNMNGIKVLSRHWKKERIKPSLKSESYNNHVEYNKRLDEFSDKINTIFRYFYLNNITPSKELVEQKISDNSFGENVLAPQFFQSFEEFINTSRTTKALGTLKKYKTVFGFLIQFQSYSCYTLHFDNINLDFYEKFRDYCFEERNTLNNYFGKLVAIIKTFMNWSFERGYHQNLEFKKFKRTEDNIEVIYLTMDELMTLFNHKFESKRLEHVKDFYCFGCFTGLRFSDLKQLKSSNIHDNSLKLAVQKTKSVDHTIPLNNYALEILRKYRDTIYEPLPKISGQKFNQYIKECCQIVGLDKPINITRYIGQKRIDRVVPKYQLITSHTARKTFVTNSLILGMKEIVVKNITGHKDENSFKRYVEIAEDFKQQEMQNTWDKVN